MSLPLLIFLFYSEHFCELQANYDAEQLKVHFANVQRRNAGFTTGAGVAYPEGPTIVPNENLEARLGLKSIEGLHLKAGWRLLPARSVGIFLLCLSKTDLAKRYSFAASLVL